MNKEKNFNFIQFNILSSLLAVFNRNEYYSTDFIIAKYLLENIHNLSKLSIYKVAEDCFISRSSIQRFIKTIGFNSFKELKANAQEVIDHQEALIEYTDYTDYENILSAKIIDMITAINHSVSKKELVHLAHEIHDTANVILLTAEDSVASLRLLQSSLATSHKLVRVVTSSSVDTELFKHLNSDDLIITFSISGNYALAALPLLRNLKAHKTLITLNRTSLFETVFDKIIYISDDITLNSRTIKRYQNVYTRYALNYFVDLLFHHYFITFMNREKQE